MKQLILFGLLITASQLSAQEVLSSGGGHFSTPDYSVSFTLGELAIETISSTDRILTQGFHQTNLTVTTILDVPQLDVKLYPNPTSDMLNIKGLENEGLVQLTLVDLAGRTVLNYSTSMLSTIDVTQLPVGFYVLTVSSINDLSINFSATIQKL